MPWYDFFGQACTGVKNITSVFGSNKPTRNANRLHGYSQIIGQAIATTTAASTIIPFKGAQVLASIYVTICSDTNLIEKFAHMGLGTTALTQFILASMIYFNDQDCTDTTIMTCKLLEYFNLIYAALLTTIGGVSEMSKNPKATDEEAPDENEAGDPPDVENPAHLPGV